MSKNLSESLRPTEHVLPTWMARPFALAMINNTAEHVSRVKKSAAVLSANPSTSAFASLITQGIVHFEDIFNDLNTSKEVAFKPTIDVRTWEFAFSSKKEPQPRPGNGLVRITGETAKKLGSAINHHGNNAMFPTLGFADLIRENDAYPKEIKAEAREIVDAVTHISETLSTLGLAREIHVTIQDDTTEIEALLPITKIKPEQKAI